jgi:hypothetical protein
VGSAIQRRALAGSVGAREHRDLTGTEHRTDVVRAQSVTTSDAEPLDHDHRTSRRHCPRTGAGTGRISDQRECCVGGRPTVLCRMEFHPDLAQRPKDIWHE